MKPRRLAVYGLTAGLLGGGAAGLAVTGTTLASTRIADVSTTTDSSVDTGTVSTGSAQARKGDWAKSALDKLVAKGTITQAQEDAILAALQAAGPDHGPGGHHGRGGPGFGNLDVVAKALGMTADELHTALDGGKSIAAIAKDKGVDVAKIADALVADLKAHLDADVKAGKLTQAQADEMLANCKARIQDFLNGTPGGGPGGRGGFGGPGHHGPGGPGGPDGQGGSPATGSTSGTTTS